MHHGGDNHPQCIMAGISIQPSSERIFSIVGRSSTFDKLQCEFQFRAECCRCYTGWWLHAWGTFPALSPKLSPGQDRTGQGRVSTRRCKRTGRGPEKQNNAAEIAEPECWYGDPTNHPRLALKFNAHARTTPTVAPWLAEILYALIRCAAIVELSLQPNKYCVRAIAGFNSNLVGHLITLEFRNVLDADL